jgi:manganese efflux pump family protein
MSLAELLVVGAVVGANNFAVALALGALGQARRRWRIAGTFGVFESALPLVGLAIGSAVGEQVAGAGRWIAAALLVALGAVALRAAGYDVADDERLGRRATTWGGLTALAAALSLDNLVAGFALGLGEVAPLLLAGVIGACSTSFTLIGLQIGSEGRRHWETPAEIASGVVLIALAVAVAGGWVI